MATWSAGNLIARMREVLEDARGTLRTITAGTYEGGLAPGLDLNEEARRAFGVITGSGSGAPTEARITSVSRSAASPPVLGNLALYDIRVEVRQVFPYTSQVKLDDTYRDAIAGVAATGADVIAQAFTYPGNLLTRHSGAATGLISGMFAYDGSSYAWRGTADEAGELEAVHRFKGIVSSAPAVS